MCGPPKAAPESGGEAAENAKVVFEILSPSSAAYDRGTKFKLYKYLESLEEYVVLEQDLPSVDVFRRQPDGSWAVSESTGMDAEVALQSLGVRLRLAELYAEVAFPPQDEGPARSG